MARIPELNGGKIPDSFYCPYCGSKSTYKKYGTDRCKDCKAVYFLEFSRHMRNSNA